MGDYRCKPQTFVTKKFHHRNFLCACGFDSRPLLIFVVLSNDMFDVSIATFFIRYIRQHTFAHQLHCPLHSGVLTMAVIWSLVCHGLKWTAAELLSYDWHQACLFAWYSLVSFSSISFICGKWNCMDKTHVTLKWSMRWLLSLVCAIR